MGKKKLVSIFIMFALVMCLFAGGKGDTAKGSLVLRVFNAKGENAVEFEQMCNDYSKETGIKVEAFSVGSGTTAIELLRAQMSSKTPPAIFSIRGLTELPEWKESGSVLDLSNVKHQAFAKLASEIPESMRLSSDGKESFGVPFNVEGYGYMVDSQMISDLFDNAQSVKIIKDLRTCSYNDFVSFVSAVDSYIKNPSAAKVTIKGNAYTFNAQKTGRAKNLTGVFAFAGSEKWTYGDHSVNVMLNLVLKSAGDANAITSAQIEQLRAPLQAYMKNIQFVTTYVGGLEESGKRGRDLINSAKFGYDQSVQAFADGKVVFLQQGNWISVNIEKIDPNVGARSSFIPVKMPVTNDMIKTGMTAEKFNSSIPIYVPNFYALNAKVSAEEQEAAMDFLLWMHKPENVQKYVINDFKAIPYNAVSSLEISDSFSKSIMTYLDEGNFISNPYMGVPKPWYRDDIAAKVMENFLIKADWSDKEINTFVDEAIAGLKAKTGK